MSTKLPELCSSCRKLKLAELGSYAWVQSRYNKRRWTCFECQEKKVSESLPRVARRVHAATPIEIEASKTLAAMRLGAIEEFKVDGLPFIYDFGIPQLRLLVEVDGRSYHHHRYGRDRNKQRAAEERGWKVVRVEPPEVGLKVQLAVERRLEQLG